MAVLFCSLGSDGKAWLRNYGVTVTDKIKFRDAFSFIGQRGLKEGSAIQKVCVYKGLALGHL